MLILSKVCAQFRDARGNVIFTVDEKNMLNFIEAPDAIQEDPLFQMLLEDRSLEASVSAVRKKQLEQDPTAGVDAAGKKKGGKTETAAAKTDDKETGEQPAKQ